MDDAPIPHMGNIVGAFKHPKDPREEAEDRKLRLISGLLGDERWEAFTEYIDDLINQYKNFDIKETDTPDVIGFKYLVSSNVVEVLELLKHLPEKLDNIEDNG